MINQKSLEKPKAEMLASMKYNLASLMIRAKGLTEESKFLLKGVVESNTRLSGKAHYKLFKLLKGVDDMAAYTHLRKAEVEAKLSYARVDYGRFLSKKAKQMQHYCNSKRLLEKEMLGQLVRWYLC